MPRPSPQTERVTAIFDLFVQTNGVGLTLSDISKRLGVNRASCLHALAALSTAGYLIRDPADKRYYLGPALAVAGRVAEEQFPALIEARANILGREYRDGNVELDLQIARSVLNKLERFVVSPRIKADKRRSR